MDKWELYEEVINKSREYLEEDELTADFKRYDN